MDALTPQLPTPDPYDVGAPRDARAREAIARRYHQYRQAMLAERSDELLSLADLEAFGEAFTGDASYMRLYGMTPSAYAALGVRLLGRTLIECCIDQYSLPFAAAVARWCARQEGLPPVGVLDPFAGSGNLLLHVARATGAELAVGIERHAGVHALTQENLVRVGFPATLHHGSHTLGLSELHRRPGWRWIVILCPPWGAAFRGGVGLDLRRTSPPLRELMDTFGAALPAAPPLFFIQTSKRLVEESFDELASSYPCLERGSRHLIFGGRARDPSGGADRQPGVVP